MTGLMPPGVLLRCHDLQTRVAQRDAMAAC